MHTETVAVGKRGADKQEVTYTLADTPADAMQLCRGNESVFARIFNRGWKGEVSDKSGVRKAAAAGKTLTELNEIVSSFDPTHERVSARGRRKQASLAVNPQAGAISLDDLRAQLEAQGIELNFEPAA